MKSEGPSSRKVTKKPIIHQIAKEAMESDGWVEIEGLQGNDATGIYNAIGRMIAEVAFRNGTMYARIDRENT